MKKQHILAALVLFLFASVSLYAGDKYTDCKVTNYEQTELSLLEGIHSDNFGLRISSAYMLGEIKSEKAVIPLTKMLRNSEDQRARLVAALSLMKIGTDRSTYVVKQGKRFNEFVKVRKLCKHLYNTYLYEKFNGKQPSQEELFAYLFE